MHTDTTLECLSQVTIALGARFREFQEKTCSVFVTFELERERSARMRRQEKKAATAETNSKAEKTSSAKQVKSFELKTYKYHALADYPMTILRFGTTDSYTTQPVGCIVTLNPAVPNNSLLERT